MKNNLRRLLWALFVAYCLVMCYLLFVRPSHNLGKPYWEQIKININLVPFKTIREYINLLKRSRNTQLIYIAVTNLFGNIAVFVPLGIFLPCLWKKLQSLKKLLFCSGIIILSVELIQLITLRGSFDIDDLILNLIGVFCGGLLFRIFSGRNNAGITKNQKLH